LIKSRGDGDTTQFEQYWQRMAARLQQIAPLLPDQTPQLTLADCGLAITGLWIEMLAEHFGKASPANPHWSGYMESLTHHQAVAAELDDYRPKLTSWLADQ
jgi:hypothetical protein